MMAHPSTMDNDTSLNWLEKGGDGVPSEQHEERRPSAMAETDLLLTSMTGRNGGERSGKMEN
eukprot:CAMPEP_0201886948 /NCGR_PEP_ID=MMETSP0902-20130614/23657_1 /ASSEMBLY_ACC=CAM_ASM_000551 /TAXON_ID=420261 /ORGANISM="Thalassiosira antarctica, Strain CCMP982" /LENGTH=61 /DNA_ID=CAMNT_0048416717 /DNA_START=1023 /DNA_END=1205 /DNA_ORIENTATION=-